MAKIPEFKSAEEAAEFWDAHGFEEYSQDTGEAEIEFVRRPKKTLTVRLDAEDIQMVEKLAQYKGLSYTALIRMWIKDMLRKESRKLRKVS